jgi:Holliday junction resolvasome RuvABC ATP-dependent DNA helicase subunit
MMVKTISQQLEKIMKKLSFALLALWSVSIFANDTLNIKSDSKGFARIANKVAKKCDLKEMTRVRSSLVINDKERFGSYAVVDGFGGMKDEQFKVLVRNFEYFEQNQLVNKMSFDTKEELEEALKAILPGC